MALEYAHRRLGEVGVAWQFPAEDPAVLAVGFGELAAQLGAGDGGDPVATVHGALAASLAPWLLVFDNAPDRASVAPFVPPAGRGRVLITSRNQIWPPGQALAVPVLDPELAAEFLISRTGDGDRQAASELAAKLGGLPLALEQAGAYIQAALLPVRERVLNKNHPHTLATRNNLARMTGEAGDPAAARDMFAALLSLREEIVGLEHPTTLATRLSLATWTGRAGNAATARDMLAALLPVEERALGPEHPRTLATRRSLADWTRIAGSNAEPCVK